MVINDTARNIKTVVDSIPEISENVVDIRHMLLRLTVYLSPLYSISQRLTLTRSNLHHIPLPKQI